ncbi:MAG: hypothetical protein U0528_17800 [Anaerolineae bacterium]
MWVLYMALFHWIGVSRHLVSLCIQISALIFLLLNLLFVRRIADLLDEDAPLIGVLAAFFTAFYLPLNTWSLLGMEVSVLTLLITFVVWRLLKQLQAGSFSFIPYLLLGIGTLIRFDVAVPFAVIMLFMALADRRWRARHLVVGGAILIAFLAAQTLFRLAYYGDPLPNTYYLKVEGYPVLLRIAYGLLSFFNYASGMNWLIYLIPSRRYCSGGIAWCCCCWRCMAVRSPTASTLVAMRGIGGVAQIASWSSPCRCFCTAGKWTRQSLCGDPSARHIVEPPLAQLRIAGRAGTDER